MTNEQILARAQRAKVILEDDTFQEAMTELKKAILDQWAAISIDNYDQQLELKRLLWAAQQFENVFTVLIANGAVAKEHLLHEKQMEKQKEKAMRTIYG